MVNVCTYKFPPLIYSSNLNTLNASIHRNYILNVDNSTYKNGIRHISYTQKPLSVMRYSVEASRIVVGGPVRSLPSIKLFEFLRFLENYSALFYAGLYGICHKTGTISIFW